MSADDAKFAPPSEVDVTRLVLENPLAWVVSFSEADFCATPLPLRPVLDARGNVERLLGHCARSNRLVEMLKRDPRALLLFIGPNGYISPSWMADRTQAPTWNYATVQYLVDIEFIDEDAELDAVMRDLVSAMEAGRLRAWSTDDMGARYRALARRIIAFKAHIRARRAKFKLGQDERDDVYADI
ncbi:MAG: FMN-binding negative transcriptional regulator, partial [Steroidobacteraceae bacterium]